MSPSPKTLYTLNTLPTQLSTHSTDRKYHKIYLLLTLFINSNIARYALNLTQHAQHKIIPQQNIKIKVGKN